MAHCPAFKSPMEEFEYVFGEPFDFVSEETLPNGDIITKCKSRFTGKPMQSITYAKRKLVGEIKPTSNEQKKIERFINKIHNKKVA